MCSILAICDNGAYLKLKNHVSHLHICTCFHRPGNFLCKIDTNIWNLHKFARRGGLVKQITNLKKHLHINFYGPYSHSAATKHNVGFDVDVFSSPLQSVGPRTIFYSVNAHNSAYWWLHAPRQLPWVIDHQRRSASLETRWKLPKRDVTVYREGLLYKYQTGKIRNWGNGQNVVTWSVPETQIHNNSQNVNSMLICINRVPETQTHKICINSTTFCPLPQYLIFSIWHL